MKYFTKALMIILALILSTNIIAVAEGIPQNKSLTPAKSGLIELEGGKESLSLELLTPPHSLAKDEDGFDVIQIEGFKRLGYIGNPQLPGEIYNIALPPDAEWESVTLDIIVLETEEIGGTFQIAPVKPPVTWVDGQKIIGWGENEDFIVDGRNTLVFEQDSFFPSQLANILTFSQMRKWNFIQLAYNPVQYNPVSGKLRLATKINISLSFNTGRITQKASLNDTIMDDTAAEIIFNYSTAKDWYGAGEDKANANPTYAIITTNAIESGSTKLANFISHKQSLGFTVLTITQDEYGSLSGQSPNGTAEKIRKWLQNNYLTQNIEYVLLIGNPDPDDPSSVYDSVGDVPMKMMWPRRGATTYPSYDESPSDYFYADLTGNWDLDGDTYFGEYNGDQGMGGVDYAYDVLVGRIPVYSTSYTALDSILQKTMNYENTSPTSSSWRKSALLPMSYSDEDTDGAHLAEAMKTNFLNGQGYASYTMYQQGSLCADANSSFASDQELFGNTVVRDRWSAHDYGIVNWWGHGSATSASTGYSGCGPGTLFSNSQASALDNDHPSFVYQTSCLNGYPENSSNLGYKILEIGGIGTLSASRVSWYAIDDFSPSYGLADNASIGYYFDREIVVNERSAADALYRVKNAMSAGWGDYSWMNLDAFNLYGDPSTSITSARILNRLYLPVLIKGSASISGFDSQFNGSSAGWTPVYGSWSIYYNYAYEGSRSGIGWASAVQDGSYTNFDYSAKLWRAGSDSANTGIIFRASPFPLSSDQDWKQGYQFGYTRNGFYSVWRLNIDDTDTALQNWTTSSYLNQGSAWNTLRVLAQNNMLYFYINGYLVFSTSDSVFSSGRVGIMYYTSDGLSSVIYTDWATLSPSGSSAPTGMISPEQQAFNEAGGLEGDASGVFLPKGVEPEFENLPPTPR